MFSSLFIKGEIVYSVIFCSPTNSTTFTTCCGVAIGAERCCPKCGEEIDGYYEGECDQTIRNNRFRIAFKKQNSRAYYAHRRGKL